jgi:hypothetical protein
MEQLAKKKKADPQLTYKLADQATVDSPLLKFLMKSS